MEPEPIPAIPEEIRAALSVGCLEFEYDTQKIIELAKGILFEGHDFVDSFWDESLANLAGSLEKLHAALFALKDSRGAA